MMTFYVMFHTLYIIRSMMTFTSTSTSSPEYRARTVYSASTKHRIIWNQLIIPKNLQVCSLLSAFIQYASEEDWVIWLDF